MSIAVNQLEWHGCYDDSWKGHIVDEAFAHPAKFARGLIDRIIKYMLAEGMLKREDVIVDPFGGIGAGGIVAASHGLRWYGCELEEKFVGLARQNFALHENVWLEFGDPLPVIVQGDSRKLREHLRGVLSVMPIGSVEAVVSSPPYAAGTVHDGNGIDQSKLVGNKAGRNTQAKAEGYGDSPGQLGQLPPGTVASVITSPPYAECLQGDNTARETAEESRAKRITEGGSLGQSCRHAGYGSAENLGNLKGGTVDSVVTSPPYEGSNDHERPLDSTRAKNGRHAIHLPYGDTVGNVGNESGETFWSAARDIVCECHAILKPGGWSAWVCKDFVRNKARVPFCDDWCKLLEACGFTVVTRVHAMLVKEQSHPDLFGGEDHVERTERKSFFRRLAERKGSPRIDFEEVIFAVALAPAAP